MRDTRLARRKFLHGLATAAAATGVKAQHTELSVGLIGAGKRGNAHLTRLLQRPDVTVRAVCDIDPKARDTAQTAARAAEPASYEDYKALLAEDSIDAVLIATPCHLHAEMAAAALRAGKHVFCEKPLAITADQVGQVLQAARESNAVFQVGQQSRNSPHLQHVVRQIHERGVIGTPLVIKAQRHGTPSRPEATREDGSGRNRRFPGWYNDVTKSGDLIVENAIHNLDVCNWLAGSRPASVCGHGKRYLPRPVPPGTVMMDGFSVEYVYRNDMHLDYSQLYLHPRALTQLPNGMWFVIYGDEGAIHVDYSSWTLYDLYGDSEPVEGVAPDGIDLTEAAHEDFVRSIRERRRPAAGIETAAIAALTAIMGREAIYQRRMVTWDELGVTV